jgi:hypothetical protein
MGRHTHKDYYIPKASAAGGLRKNGYHSTWLFEHYTVKKIGHGLDHIKTNLRFFGLSLNFYSNF